jgi:hypothetical protein
MKIRRIAALALLLSALPMAAAAGGRGGYARPSGGFDFHGESGGGSHPPQTYNHSSTGPYGTNRTTTATSNGNGYNRTTTATNGNYSRTTNGGASSNGNYYHNSNGSGPYGSYSHSGSGNAYDRTYSGSTTATNAWGQTYHSSTNANNGYVYHGAVVTNPVYHGYPAWGWNGGYAWYAAPSYWGGGFWGAFAIGATSAAVYGAVVAANSATYTSYQVEPSSPGAKLLASYHLTQTQCGPPNLVVIYGPNNSVICAYPNQLVAAGNYSVNSQTLTIVSEKPAS